MKTIILTTLFAILFSNTTVLTTSIEGKVIDKETGEPIIFGVVSLYKNGVLTNNAETDLDGNFMISDIQPGKYDVEIQYLGYKTKRITDVICLAGQVKRLIIEMEVEGELLSLDKIITVYTKLIDIDSLKLDTIITTDKINKLTIIKIP